MQSINWRIVTEIVASLSILVSLVFVGLEVRKNSAIASSESYNEFALAVSDGQLRVAEDLELAELVRRTIFNSEGDASLNASERFRVTLFFQSALRIWEGMYRSVKEGVLVESDLTIVQSYRGMLNNTVFREYWTRGKTQFLPGFAEYIDTILETQ